MTSSNSTSTTDENPSVSESKKHKSRVALYTDEERFQIIHEIYKRRFLWSVESKEVLSISHTVRKQAFNEIADQVSTQSSILRAEDVERQWKNLKDTYVKIRKKLTLQDGNQTLPRWRFYRLLQFIDPDETVAGAFDFDREMDFVQSEQQKSENSKSSNSSTSANTSPANLQFNNHLPLPNGIRQTNILNSALIPPHLPPNQSVNRLKRTQNEQLGYVRHHPIATQNHPLPGQAGSSNESTPTLSKEPRIATPNGTLPNGLNVCEDEYVMFCSSLVHPLREIGHHSKFEYLKLQKMIHDALFDIQSRIHSTTNGATGSK